MALIVTVPLLIPLIAMQFTNEVNWGFADFALAGVLLLSGAIGCDTAIRKVSNVGLKTMICLGIVIILGLLWAELAVGIFGTPLAGS